MEMVINMLMPGRGAGEEHLLYPSHSYLFVCVCVRGKTEMEKEEAHKGTGNAQGAAYESTCTQTHTLTLCSGVNRRELHVNVPPFFFNLPLETVQRVFCEPVGEIRSRRGGGSSGDLQSQLFLLFFL